MGKLKIAINGMGRIGRTVIRELYKYNVNDIEVVAVNNPGKPDIYVHLLKYDSLHGRFNADVKLDGDNLCINNDNIKFFSVRDPSEIPWTEAGADIVIDATGRFKDTESLSAHLGGSVKKVILCAPGKVDATFVMGINHETYDPAKHNVVSNASCTTNCLAPIAKVLNDKWGIENGFMTTIHAYTSDQQLLDGSHKDERRARAAALSMVPTTTGAAKAVGLVIPELSGKLDGHAIRVPTPDVSLVDLTANLSAEVSVEQVNTAMKEASEGALKGVLGYCDENLVSVDFMGAPEASIYDSSLTNVNGKTVKVSAWYDNEVGFSNKVIDLARYIGEKL